MRKRVTAIDVGEMSQSLFACPQRRLRCLILRCLSGLTKQEYIVNRLMNRDVVVVPSSRVHRALRDSMGAVYRELRRLRNEAEVGPELEAVIGILAREFAGLSEGSAPSDIEAEDRVINAIRRQE